MKLEPVPQGSLVDSVVERIRIAIETDGMNAGDRLPSEFEMANSLQVSRTVLREAVSRLEAIGLLTVRRGSGMYVGDRSTLSRCVQLVRSAAQISPRDLIQFVEFRAALECYSARRAAELAKPQDIAELERLCKCIDEPGVEHEENYRRDFEFHRKLMAIAGNELMDNVMDVVRELMLEGMVRSAVRPRDRKLSQRLHLKILSAIKRGDADAAEAAMRLHMDKLLQRLKAGDSQQ